MWEPMSRKLLCTTAAALALGTGAYADAPSVAVDIAPLHSLVARVMDGVGTPDLVIPAGASPHEHTLRPSEAAALENADVVFWMGEDLTPWMEDAVETLAGDASVTALLDADGTTLLDFREDALFEAHDHSDHDDHGHEDHADAEHDHDHDDHGHEDHAEAKHDDHGHEDHAEAKHDHDHDDHGHEDHADASHDDHDHGDHAHGAHGFEWSGLFDLKPGTYAWSFAKVDGDYADPAMKMVILAADDIEAVEETAEELLEAEAADEKADGDALIAQDLAYSLNFDSDKDMTVFSVEIAEPGKYAFFTEHMPFEFEANEHFFKDTTGADVEPISQEPDGDHGHGHGHDHGHGHAHGAHDPHAWLSPNNAAAWLNVIAAQLSAADPDNAGAYFANAAAGQDEIEALKAEVAATLAPVEGKRFIVFHDAYQYFENDFDFSASGAISLGDAADPSPARIAEIQARVRDEGIDCVLSEPQYNPGLVATVADGTEVSTGVLDPLGSDLEPGAALYPQLLRNLATALADCL
ncbi:MAG: zinc ABC transporter substrate-binding protein [Pseudomonadota bacterium]